MILLGILMKFGRVTVGIYYTNYYGVKNGGCNEDDDDDDDSRSFVHIFPLRGNI